MSILRKNTAALSLIAAMGLASGNVYASLNADLLGTTNINNFDINVGNANFGNGASNTGLNNIDQLNWSGYILSDFGAGSPGVSGSTFTDYVVLKLGSAQDEFGSSENGGCLNFTCEITLVAQLSGEMTGASGSGQFKITGVNSMKFFLDTANVNANVGSVTGMNGYTDGTLVLTGSNISTLTNIGANTGSLTPFLGAGGGFNFQNQLFPVIGKDFLYSTDRAQSLFDAVSPEGLYSLIEGQITLQGLGVAGSMGCLGGVNCNLITNNFVSKFGLNPNSGFELASVQTSPTENIASKIPEPSSIALIGLGLIGFGISIKRRQSDLETLAA